MESTETQDGNTAQDSSLEQPQEGLDPSSTEGSQAEEEKVPWNQDARWLQWRKEEKELRASAQRASQYEKDLNEHKRFIQENQSAIGLWNSLQGDQAKLKQVLDLITNPQPSQPSQDPYAGFDPVIAEKLRVTDQLQEQMQRLEQEKYEIAVSQNMQSLETTFNDMCAKAKIAGPHYEVLTDLTLSEFSKKYPGQDPRTASVAQLDEVFKSGMKKLDAFRKAERQSFSVPSVPASGTKTGSPARMESYGTDEDRKRGLARALFNGE